MKKRLAYGLKVMKRRYFRFDTLRWIGTGFKSPSPQWVKVKLLTSSMISNGEWLETGTYLGDTTNVLSKHANRVTTIEPSRELFNFSRLRLKTKRNIAFHNGSSEELFHECLLKSGPRLNIWLDGHFSGDITFKGKTNTPIICELNAISQELERFEEIRIFIDDVRCFYHDMNEGNDYPKLDFLIAWARENGFKWRIEQDIFIAEFESPLK